MNTALVTFLFSFLLSLVLTPLARRLGFRIGAVSTPGGRHVHARKVPRIGGVAIYISFVIPLLALFFLESSVARIVRAEWVRVLGLMAGGLVMAVVGVLDDTRRVRALYKLYAQIFAALIAWFAGFRIDAISLPFGSFSMGIFALPITVLWIVGIINAINLIDGLDGLAGGIVFFAALTNVVIGFINDSIFVVVPMSAVLGSVLGFLAFNFNPARIFMGDSGSYFLGFTLATVALAGTTQKASTAVSIIVPVLALGVPIFDTLFAMVRRFLERRPIFSPDRGHIHHRLLDIGLTHRRAVLILYGISVALTMAAISISLGKQRQAGVALLVASVAVFGIIRSTGSLGTLHLRNRQKARIRNADVQRLRRAIPILLDTLTEANNFSAVDESLRRFAELSKICQLDLVKLDDETTKVTTRTFTEFGDPESPDVLSARYPLGRDDNATHAIRFKWFADNGEVDPQADILLQLVADAVTRRLRSMSSELVASPTASEIEVDPAAAFARESASD